VLTFTRFANLVIPLQVDFVLTNSAGGTYHPRILPVECGHPDVEDVRKGLRERVCRGFGTLDRRPAEVGGKRAVRIGYR
jgi:hypothetical protein